MRRDLILLLGLALAAVAWLAARVQPTAPAGDRLDTTALLSEAPETFERVTGPRAFEFPRDHAAHPGVRSEWWYFTGNLETRAGRAIGFQFTLFRFGLDAGTGEVTLDDAFAGDAVWMAHLAVSDRATGRFLNRERFARGAQGLAGATEDRWWLRDWQVVRNPEGWRLQAGFEDVSLDLALEPQKPIVRQGQDGYSRKGPSPGNASHYYSVTRMQASGQLVIDGRKHPVEGSAWLDREWGSSQLGPDIEGWDWFALQLDDGRDLMVYRLRTDTGEASPFSSGSLVEADGTARILAPDDFELRPGRVWRDADGVEWPVDWRVRVPSAGLDLAVQAAFDAQLWRTQVRYWEGSVDVLDVGTGRSAGRGYLELSGYGGSAGGAARR